MLAIVALVSPTAQASSTLLTENWEAGIDLAVWNRWGVPSPVLQAGGNAIGSLSLDPNGDGSYHSGAVSIDEFTLSSGIRVSIDAYIESASQWSELTFGLASTNSIATNPNLNLSSVAEVTIDADTQGSGYKFYTRFMGAGGTEVDYATGSPQSYFDAWHTYVFDFAADGSARVRVDDVLVFQSTAGLYDYSIDDQFAVLLGGRSYGATINLYDSISVTQIPEPSTGLLVATGLLGLAARRRADTN